MKPDLDLIKRLLDDFEAAPGPHTDVLEVKKRSGWDDDEVLYFHLRLLRDRGLIEGADRNPDSIGFVLDRGRFGGWTASPIRLTAIGHDFAASLRQKNVMERLKTKLSDAGLTVWMQIAIPLALEAAKHQLGLGD